MKIHPTFVQLAAHTMAWLLFNMGQQQHFIKSNTRLFKEEISVFSAIQLSYKLYIST